MSERHIPVLLNEVVDALQPRDGGRYVDGTFGAGGYTTAMLDRADCQVIAIDRDPDAIGGGRALAERYAPRLHLIEAGPVAVLLLSSFALVAGTGPAMDYLGRAGESLSAPQAYIDAVLNTHASPVSSGEIDQEGT